MENLRAYRIIRFYANGRRPRTIKTGLTHTEAQAHCNDPKTRKEGVYFDGYDYIKGVREQEVDEQFKPVKALVALANLFGTTEPERNALKKRALSTVPGIDFPDDFDKLPTEEQKRRLDGAAKFLTTKEG